MDKVTRIAQRILGHASRPIVTPRVSPTRGAASQQTVDALFLVRSAGTPCRSCGAGQDARPRSARQETDAQIAQRVHSTWSLSSSVRWMNPLQPLPLPTGPDSADNRQGEMPALRVTDGDASTGHPLASRAEDAVELTGARIAARQRTRIRHELVTTHAVGAVGAVGPIGP